MAVNVIRIVKTGTLVVFQSWVIEQLGPGPQHLQPHLNCQFFPIKISNENTKLRAFYSDHKSREISIPAITMDIHGLRSS